MKFIKKNLKDKWLYVTLFITLIIFLIAFKVAGIYPCGKNTYTLIDFDGGYIPVFYKLWDILHGKSSMMFDFNIGTGLNPFGSLVMNSLWTPTSLIIGLFNRSFIPYAISYVFLLKYIVAAFLTYISISYLFPKLDSKIKASLSILYVFSGWTVTMQSALPYLDVFGIFPVFVVAFYRLLKYGKWKMYLIVLTICLLSSYYMSYLILFFIVGATLGAFFLTDIDDKKKKIVMVVILTLASLFLSFALILSSLYQSLTSARMNGMEIRKYDINVFFLKLLSIMPEALLIVLTGKELKKKDKYNKFFIFMIIYTFIGIFVEPINKMWHTGSYFSLPFRYSFISIFTLIYISGYYLNKRKEENSSKYFLVLNIISLILFAILTYLFKDAILKTLFVTNLSLEGFIIFLILFIVSLISALTLIKIDKKYFNYFMLINAIITSLGFNIYMSHPRLINNTALETEKIKENLKIKNDHYNIVDYTNDLNTNYPYILDRPSINNRVHILKDNFYKFAKNVGYPSVHQTIIESNGSNIFLNMILMNKYYITKYDMPSKLYRKIDSYKDYNLYESIYNLPYIIPYDGTIYNKEDNIYNNTNNIYKLFNSGNIMHKSDNNIKKNNIYYLEFNSNEEPKFNKDIHIIYLNKDKNKYIVSLYTDNDTKLDALTNLKIYYININDLIDFYNKYNYKVSIKDSSNTRIYKYKFDSYKDVLIPMQYDDNFKIYVNNKEVKYERNIYNLISVKLNRSEGTIKIVYYPKMLKEGIIISIVTLILIIVISILNKHINLLDKKIILYPLFIISIIILILFFLKTYIISVLKAL